MQQRPFGTPELNTAVHWCRYTHAIEIFEGSRYKGRATAFLLLSFMLRSVPHKTVAVWTQDTAGALTVCTSLCSEDCLV